MTTQDIFFNLGEVTDGDTYFRVPFRCTVRGLSGVTSADCSDETFTVSSGSDDIGTLTFPDEVAYESAGAGYGGYTPDSTNGDKVLDKGAVLQITTDDDTAQAFLTLELDPFGRKA